MAEGGYGAALLLDSWALLGRADLRAGEETLRRWMNAATLVRPASAGGQVIVVAADAAHPVVQALVRWDPAWLAERELADRRELGFPPVTRIASLAGSPAALAEFLAAARLPDDADLLGPVPEPPRPGQDGRAGALPGAGAARRGARAGPRADRGAGRAQREEGARARARAAGPARPRLSRAGPPPTIVR